ncbi:MAG: DUF29 family protein [Deltaproteobacteria bacterium]|nr:DUF29 family protein [Deltaproteobacteria bacterium]
MLRGRKSLRSPSIYGSCCNPAQSPSLQTGVAEKITEAYEDAVLIAAKETGLDETNFPQVCPYSFEQAIDKDFWPE